MTDRTLTNYEASTALRKEALNLILAGYNDWQIMERLSDLYAVVPIEAETAVWEAHNELNVQME